jgi:hypothetical protein
MMLVLISCAGQFNLFLKFDLNKKLANLRHFLCGSNHNQKYQGLTAGSWNETVCASDILSFFGPSQAVLPPSDVVE